MPEISNWNTKSLNNMECLFYECPKLAYISDISNWDTNNVKNMSFVFYKCSSLTSLDKLEHSSNSDWISFTLLVFHFEISGNDVKEEHL